MQKLLKLLYLLRIRVFQQNLSNFYRRFMESEAGHYTLFIELAETYVAKEKARLRWQQWLQFEAEVMKELAVRGDRIH